MEPHFERFSRCVPPAMEHTHSGIEKGLVREACAARHGPTYRSARPLASPPYRKAGFFFRVRAGRAGEEVIPLSYQKGRRVFPCKCRKEGAQSRVMLEGKAGIRV